MVKTIDIIWTSILAVLLFWLSSLLIDPIPIPSLSALVLGLLLFWKTQKKWYLRLIFGLVAGGIIGSGVHLYSHYSEHRMEPADGIATHVFLDFVFGVLIALAIACIILFAYNLRNSISTHETHS